MKTSIVYLIIGLLVINSLNAQVKIGDNPQNLDPASILELQSSNRVLVITRVTDAQMSGISPLPGAVVYNTDQGCLHYYNGTEWINICEELDNSFTVSTRADSLQQVNPNARDNTIAILESINPDGSTNYNFEVNRITGANIVDTSINGSTKLQNESVTNNKLAEKSVGLRNLADATSTGDLLIYNGTAWNFVNRTDLLNTQLDSIVGNEVTDATLNGSLIRNGAGETNNPYTLDVADGGINTSELSDDAVTNAKLDKANIPLSGFAAAAANVDLGNNRIIDLADPVDALDAVNLQSLNAAILDSESNDNDTDPNNENQTVSAGTGIAVNQTGQDFEVTNTSPDQTVTLTDGGSGNVTVGGTYPNFTIDVPDNTDSQNLSIGAGGTPNQFVEVAISGGTNALVDVRDEDADPANENQTVSAGTGIAVNQTGQDFEVTNTSPDQTVTLTDGGSGNVTVGGTYPNFTIDVPDNTDSQNLSIGAGGTPNQFVEVAISGGTNALVDVRDEDADPANENQTVSAGTGIAVNQTGQDFEVTNTSPDQTVTLTDGGSGNVTVGGTYPNFTIDVPDNTDSQNLSIGAGGTPNQFVEVAISGGTNALVDVRDEDADPANENQTVSAGTGIAVNQTGQDFIVSITNPVVAMGKVSADALTVNATGVAAVSGVTRTGLGNYSVLFDNARPNGNYIIQLTLQNTAHNVSINVTAQNPNGFEVTISETFIDNITSPGTPTLDSNPIDAEWFFTVTDFIP